MEEVSKQEKTEFVNEKSATVNETTEKPNVAGAGAGNPPKLAGKERKFLAKKTTVTPDEVAEVRRRNPTWTRDQCIDHILLSKRKDSETPTERLTRELTAVMRQYDYDLAMGKAYDKDGKEYDVDRLHSQVYKFISTEKISNKQFMAEFNATLKLVSTESERITTGAVIAQKKLMCKYTATEVAGAFDEYAREMGVRESQLFAVRACFCIAARRAANLTNEPITAGPMLIFNEGVGGKGKGTTIELFSRALTGYHAEPLSNSENGFEFSGVGENPRFVHLDESLTPKIARNIKSMLTQPTVGGRAKCSNTIRTAPARCTFIGSTNSIEEYFKDCGCQDGGMNRRFIVINYRQPYVGITEQGLKEKAERAAADIVLNPINEPWFELRVKLEDCARASFASIIQKEDALTVTINHAIHNAAVEMIEGNIHDISFNELTKLVTDSRIRVKTGMCDREITTGRNKYKKGNNFVNEKLTALFGTICGKDKLGIDRIVELYNSDHCPESLRKSLQYAGITSTPCYISTVQKGIDQQQTGAEQQQKAKRDELEAQILKHIEAGNPYGNYSQVLTECDVNERFDRLGLEDLKALKTAVKYALHEAMFDQFGQLLTRELARLIRTYEYRIERNYIKHCIYIEDANQFNDFLQSGGESTEMFAKWANVGGWYDEATR